MMVVRLILILFVLGMLLVIFASNPPAGKAPPMVPCFMPFFRTTLSEKAGDRFKETGQMDIVA